MCYNLTKKETIMAKTEVVRARINPDLKRNVELLLSKLGLTTTEAITLFFHQMELRKGLPFLVELPNEETRDVFEKTDQGEKLVECEDADDMFRKLNI
jgi:DNA-damage-inducible protein J